MFPMGRTPLANQRNPPPELVDLTRHRIPRARSLCFRSRAAPMDSRVIIGGEVPAGKGMDLPSSRVDMPSFTDKDREDLRFGREKGGDFVAGSPRPRLRPIARDER